MQLVSKEDFVCTDIRRDSQNNGTLDTCKLASLKGTATLMITMFYKKGHNEP